MAENVESTALVYVDFYSQVSFLPLGQRRCNSWLWYIFCFKMVCVCVRVCCVCVYYCFLLFFSRYFGQRQIQHECIDGARRGLGVRWWRGCKDELETPTKLQADAKVDDCFPPIQAAQQVSELCSVLSLLTNVFRDYRK